MCIRLENIPDVVESGKYSCVGESIRIYIYMYSCINFSITLPGENIYIYKLKFHSNFLSSLPLLNFSGLDLILDERNGRGSVKVKVY